MATRPPPAAPSAARPGQRADTSFLVSALLQLFQGKPDESFLKDGWATDAVFEDPITLTKGYDQFAPQWYGLAKVFSTSDTLAYKVTKFDTNLGEH